MDSERSGDVLGVVLDWSNFANRVHIVAFTDTWRSYLAHDHVSAGGHALVAKADSYPSFILHLEADHDFIILRVGLEGDSVAVFGGWCDARGDLITEEGLEKGSCERDTHFLIKSNIKLFDITDTDFII